MICIILLKMSFVVMAWNSVARKCLIHFECFVISDYQMKFIDNVSNISNISSGFAFITKTFENELYLTYKRLWIVVLDKQHFTYK